jgi:hypothetical protein
MPTPIVILAAFGLFGVIAGMLALISNYRLPRGSGLPGNWSGLRKLATFVGAVVGLATWPLTYFMGDPISTPDGPGRVVGIPFFVAFFDSAGRDYVGPLTLPGAVANVAFWALFPQVVLYAYRWRFRN